MNQNARLVAGFLFGSSLFLAGVLLRYHEGASVVVLSNWGFDRGRVMYTITELGPALFRTGLMMQCAVLLAWIALGARPTDRS